MSTRCNIIIQQKHGNKTSKAFLYHHHDGYPSYMGQVLVEFMKQGWYDPKNISDHELINRLIRGIEIKCEDDKVMEDNGFRWTSDLHGDIDYYYMVDLTTWEVDEEQTEKNGCYCYKENDEPMIRCYSCRCGEIKEHSQPGYVGTLVYSGHLSELDTTAANKKYWERMDRL